MNENYNRAPVERGVMQGGERDMLNRADVKENKTYWINKKLWHLHIIHKPGNGESVTLCDVPRNDDYYRLAREKKIETCYMQMRKFQRSAVVHNAGNDPRSRVD